MSIGFQARANLVCSDESGFLYTYACCNLNQRERWQAAWETEDGEIMIYRGALIEPEIHEKVRRLPSGRKKTVIKRIPYWAPVEELITEGKITVKNASGTWETECSVDMMAIHLIQNVFQDYQVQGTMPGHVFVAY